MGLLVNDVIQARLKVTGPVAGGQIRTYNVIMHYFANSAGNVSLTSFGAQFNAGVGATAKLTLSAQTNIIGSYVRKLNVPDLAEVFTAIGGVGAIAGDCCSSALAAVIQKNTGLRGKQFRGFSHFALVAESDTTGDQLTVGDAPGTWKDLANAMLGSITVAGPTIVCYPCVIQKTASNLLLGTPIYGTQLNNTVVSKILGTMKRRKEKAAI